MYDVFDELMRKNGITKYKISKDTGISQTFFADWEKGKYQPKLDKLQKIASYFSVSVDYLMGREQPESQITFNDFTYAMFNESKELTEEDKSLLLQMARQLGDKNKKSGKTD